MHRDPIAPPCGFTRRTALGRAAAVGVALSLGRLGRAAAQDATPTATDIPWDGHPFVGVWQWDFEPENH
jgi:hypothetical protein